MELKENKTYSIIELEYELLKSDPDLYKRYINYAVNKKKIKKVKISNETMKLKP